MTNTDFWQREGQSAGQVILLLHGWQRNRHDLQVLSKSLSKNYLVYSLTLPGFMGAELAAEEVQDWKLSDYVKYVCDFIERQQIKPIIFGHSFGGRIAVKLAALYPELIADSLVLCGVPGLKQAQNPGKTLKISALKLLAKFCKLSDRLFATNLFQNYFIPNFASADYMSANALKNVFVKVINEDLAPYASKIQKKTLLLWGAKDQEASLGVARAYHALIFNSELRILQYHGHSPFADVGGHLCAKIISNFIGQKEIKKVPMMELVDSEEVEYADQKATGLR